METYTKTDLHHNGKLLMLCIAMQANDSKIIANRKILNPAKKNSQTSSLTT